MQWMSTIVRAEIDRGWDQVYYSCTNSKKFQMSQFFNDPQPLDLEALQYVTITWSKYFVTMYITLR